MMSLPQFVLDFFRSELFRYIISGFIAFFCDFAILVTATEVFGIHYLVSNIAGYSVGLIVSYTININWVFNHRRFGDKQHHEFVYFTVIVFTGLGISELVLWAATESGDIHYTWSKVVSTFFVFVFNFIVKRRLLFSPAKN